MVENTFEDFYSPSGSHSKCIKLSKSQGEFYSPVDKTRPLIKGKDTDVAAILEFHMKKASESERAKNKKKSLEDF